MYNLKNSSKFKLLAFWRKYTPLIDQKCTYEKVKKIGQGPSSPSLAQNSKEQILFKTFPYRLIYIYWSSQSILGDCHLMVWWNWPRHAKNEYSWKFFPPADKALISQAVKKSKVFSNFLFQIFGMFSMSVVVWNVRIFLSQMVCTSF